MKVFKWIITSIVFVIVIFVLYFVFQLSGNNKNIKIEFEIKKGMSINEILVELKNDNIIRDVTVSKIYIKLFNINNFQSGIYELNSSDSSVKIFKQISNGKVSRKDEVKLTLIEGKGVEELVKTIVKNTNNKEEDIYSLISDEKYIDLLISKYWFLTDDIKKEGIRYSLEGYLFPDTYFILKDSSIEFIIDKLLSRTEEILNDYKTEIDNSKYTVHEIITMASIIELESGFDDDRGLISGIFYKRLETLGWQLQSCVTSYYGAGLSMSNSALLQSAIDSKNPYNTYHNSVPGLPIGPIGSPGKASIEASLNPVKSEYWFFVSDCKTRKTVFTKTYAEHVKATNDIKASGCQF